jgi:hypothetical protein
MQTRPALILALLLASGPPGAAQADAGCYPRSACKADCDRAKREIREIQAKMRQGYSASRGAKMEARLRELRKLRSKLCP